MNLFNDGIYQKDDRRISTFFEGEETDYVVGSESNNLVT